MIKLTGPRIEVLMALDKLGSESSWVSDRDVADYRKKNVSSTIRVLTTLSEHVPKLVDWQRDRICDVLVSKFKLTVAGRTVVETQLKQGGRIE